MKTISIASGSAGAADREDAALDVVTSVAVDYLCYDAMAEMTLPAQALRRQADPGTGYDVLLEARLREVLPIALGKGTKIVGNFGGVNPEAAARLIARLCDEAGHPGARIGLVQGDDLTSEFLTSDRSEGMDGDLITANAYLGAPPIVQCLRDGADIVVTGRVADPSLFLAPLMYEFGWAEEDWDLLGAGTIIGHLLECGTLATGGYYADGRGRQVPGAARVGLPIAHVTEDLEVRLTKAPGTGGLIRTENFRLQLMHELNDPSAYLTPDVVADLTTVGLTQIGDETVGLSWVGTPRGTERPEKLKVLVGAQQGWVAEILVFIPGRDAHARAQVVEDVARERYNEVLKLPLKDLRFQQLFSDPGNPNELGLVLRITAWTDTQEVAQQVVRYGEYLVVVGPTGLGEKRLKVAPRMKVYSALVPRHMLRPVTSVRSATEVLAAT